MATADQQRRWRASKGARTGQPGPPPTVACGTPAGWRRHQRLGEPIDQACRDAWATYQRDYQKRKGTT